MRKKKVLVIVLTALVFVSIVVLGITTVYRVNALTLNTVVVSQAAKPEAEELEKRLLKAYDKDSFFSCDKAKAEAILEEYPYFRLTSFKKAYPNRIIVEITEDAEVYAVPVSDSDSYYILGADGLVLGVRETYINRFDGEENLLINGLRVTGEEGQILSGDVVMSPLLTFCNKVSTLVEGIRRNVVSIEVIRRASVEEETIIRVTMREGVKLYVGNPAAMPEEKAQAAVEKYLSLSDQERLMGRITVSDNAGEVLVGYAERDEFAS